MCWCNSPSDLCAWFLWNVCSPHLPESFSAGGACVRHRRTHRDLARKQCYVNFVIWKDTSEIKHCQYRTKRLRYVCFCWATLVLTSWALLRPGFGVPFSYPVFQRELAQLHLNVEHEVELHLRKQPINIWPMSSFPIFKHNSRAAFND